MQWICKNKSILNHRDFPPLQMDTTFITKCQRGDSKQRKTLWVLINRYYQTKPNVHNEPLKLRFHNVPIQIHDVPKTFTCMTWTYFPNGLERWAGHVTFFVCHMTLEQWPGHLTFFVCHMTWEQSLMTLKQWTGHVTFFVCHMTLEQ